MDIQGERARKQQGQGFLVDKEIKRCGCYVRKADPNQPNELVPLKHIDYDLEIANSLLHVTLTQKYFNPLDKFLEVDYSFPISPETSMYKFMAQFEDVTIQGIVKEKEQAHIEYNQALLQGRQAVLAQLDPQSIDIMSLQIGNIPPKTGFIITISFLQQMAISHSTFYKLIIPSTISPRYANKFADLQRKIQKNVFRKEGETLKSGKPDFTWSFTINLKTTQKLIFFDSPSHEIELLQQNDSGCESKLAMKKSEIPNRDFTFLFTTQNFHIPSCVMGRTDASATVMLSFIPKFCQFNVDDAYRAALKQIPLENPLNSTKGDYIFLIDRSGSMGGFRIEKAKEALIIFLKSLPEDSFFNVVSFGSSSEKMFPQSVKYANNTIHYAVEEVKNMRANFGGTEIYRPLKSLLQQKINDGFPKHIYLLTDGGVANTEHVIQLVKKKTKYCRVHCIGIGNGASFSLIQGCAKEGKGKYTMISDDQNPAQKIIDLLNASLTPIIDQIKFIYEQQAVESVVPNPKSVPYILKDEAVNFYLTYAKPFTEKQKFTFEYTDSFNKLPYKIDIEIDPESSPNFEFIDKMAHFKVLRTLESASESQVNDPSFALEGEIVYAKVKDFKKETVDYSIKHQVLSKFTSFLCVGKKLVDKEFQEYLDKGTGKVHVEQIKPYEYQPYNVGNYPPGKILLSRPNLKDKNACCGGGGSSSYKSEQKMPVFTEQPIKQPSCKKETFQNPMIQEIVESQNAEGSWSDEKILKTIKLKLNQIELQKLYEEFSKIVILTYLIVLWLEKNYKQKKYHLILKKAVNWLQNTLKQDGVGSKGQELKSRLTALGGF